MSHVLSNSEDEIASRNVTWLPTISFMLLECQAKRESREQTAEEPPLEWMHERLEVSFPGTDMEIEIVLAVARLECMLGICLRRKRIRRR
jgi:hypothetical protein